MVLEDLGDAGAQTADAVHPDLGPAERTPAQTVVLREHHYIGSLAQLCLHGAQQMYADLRNSSHLHIRQNTSHLNRLGQQSREHLEAPRD